MWSNARKELSAHPSVPQGWHRRNDRGSLFLGITAQNRIQRQRSDTMASGVLLDVIVKYATISDTIQPITTPLWVVLHVDGLQAPFSTERATGDRPVWNFAARILLQGIDISRAYLYATLCTYGPHNQAIALARSRIGLRSLPTGSPRQFSFPLMREANGAQVFAELSLAATLAHVTSPFKSDVAQRPKPLMQVPGVHSTTK